LLQDIWTDLDVTKKSETVKREERRKMIAANLEAGLTYRDIMTAFEKRGEHVSLGTISRDVKIILGRLRRDQINKTEDWISLECRRLDVALNAIWDKVQGADLAAVDRLLSIQARRAKYLGLDEPTEFKLSDDELMKEYRGLLDQLAQRGQEKEASESGDNSSQDAEAGGGDAEAATDDPGTASGPGAGKSQDPVLVLDK